jgi:hypothetical protein
VRQDDVEEEVKDKTDKGDMKNNETCDCDGDSDVWGEVDGDDNTMQEDDEDEDGGGEWEEEDQEEGPLQEDHVDVVNMMFLID